MACLKRTTPTDDPPFHDWLVKHYQTQRTVDRFWGLVLVSALNETPDRIGLRYARKVFRDGFLSHRRGFEIQLPAVPLGRLYGAELQGWLASHQVDLRFSQGAKKFIVRENDHVEALERAPGRINKGGLVRQCRSSLTVCLICFPEPRL